MQSTLVPSLPTGLRGLPDEAVCNLWNFINQIFTFAMEFAIEF
jgi:hypothetical protein